MQTAAPTTCVQQLEAGSWAQQLGASVVPGSCPSWSSPFAITPSCGQARSATPSQGGRARHGKPVYPAPVLTSSTSLTAFSSRGLASSIAAVAVSAASKTLSRPLVSIWRAILVQMYTKSSRATPAQSCCKASAQTMSGSLRDNRVQPTVAYAPGWQASQLQTHAKQALVQGGAILPPHAVLLPVQVTRTTPTGAVCQLRSCARHHCRSCSLLDLAGPLTGERGCCDQPDTAALLTQSSCAKRGQLLWWSNR